MLLSPRVTVDHYSRRAYVEGKEVHLTRQEWKVLNLLQENKAVHWQEIASELFGDDPLAQDRQNVRVWVFRLRNKLGKDTITTLPGFGYRFDG